MRWQIDHVDFATWRAWGDGRSTSRTLPDGALTRAQLIVDAVLSLPADSRWIEQPDRRRARVLGRADRGGLRIDGGENGFEERTISLIDIGWVVVANDLALGTTQVLDETLINRVRYLEGTPKASTRWIDTAWAIATHRRGNGLVREPSGAGITTRKMRRDDRKPVDASFSVEPIGDRLTIVFESRGGTRGTAGERNTEYATGLTLLLERLKARGIVIRDAVVESRDTASTPAEKRLLNLTDREYPFEIDDAESVRRAMTSAQAGIGRAPGARGSGNGTKRIRIYVDGASLSGEELAKIIEGPASRL